MSIFFRTVTKLLGVRHHFTAALSKQSNGRTENAIKQLNAGLRLYSSPEVDDLTLESILPLVELGVRANANEDTRMSPFAIGHGYEMKIPATLDVEIPSFCSSDAENYAQWLKTSIDMLHQAVRVNRVENKEAMKQTHDRRYNAIPSQFAPGDWVLLKDVRIPPHSNRVLTRRPYEKGPFIISDVIKHETTGPAFKLVEVSSGKPLRNLVMFDRLKPYRSANQVSAIENQDTDRNKESSKFAVCRKILTDRMTHRRRHYLVLFADGRRKWKEARHIGDGISNEYTSRML